MAEANLQQPQERCNCDHDKKGRLEPRITAEDYVFDESL